MNRFLLVSLFVLSAAGSARCQVLGTPQPDLLRYAQHSASFRAPDLGYGALAVDDIARCLWRDEYILNRKNFRTMGMSVFTKDGAATPRGALSIGYKYTRLSGRVLHYIYANLGNPIPQPDVYSVCSAQGNRLILRSVGTVMMGSTGAMVTYPAKMELIAEDRGATDWFRARVIGTTSSVPNIDWSFSSRSDIFHLIRGYSYP